jgi:hypothetical protein
MGRFKPDQMGRFKVEGLPPASYVAVALEYLEPGQESNPEFLERLQNLGTSVRLTEGEKKSVTLKLSTQGARPAGRRRTYAATAVKYCVGCSSPP